MVLPMYNIYSIYNYLVLALKTFSKHIFKNIYLDFSMYMQTTGTPLKGTNEETLII